VGLGARLFGIRPGEGRAIVPVVALMFLAVGGLTLGESAIGALFFDRIGADALPRVYLAQGVVGLVGMLTLTAALGRFERRRAYVALPALLALLVAVERTILATDPGWIYVAMWLTITLAYLLQAVFLWGTAGLVTDTRKAKRLFPLFGAATILGAVVGGVATRPLAAAIGAENLLVVWAALLVSSSALVAAILGVRRRGPGPRVRRRRTSALRELREGFGFVRRSPLLRWMAIASVLFSLLYFSLYLPFARAAAASYPDPEELAGFLGLFWAAVTGAAFVTSVAFANRLLGWFGAAAVVLVLPVLYAGAFGTLLVTTAFQSLVALRFGVSVWLQGVTSPAWETLVNVTPEHRRDQTRAFLNGGPAQAGTAIAGVIQLVGRDVLSPRQLSVIGLVAAAVTIGVAWRIRRSYTAALVDALRAGRPNVFEGAVPNSPIRVRTDAQVLELAAGAIRDPDPRIRRLGAELLASADDPRSAEALEPALEDDDTLVRAAATHALAERGALSEAELERALIDEDPEVRAATVRAGAVSERALADVDPSVAAAAAARMLDGPLAGEALATLGRLLAAEVADVRLAALRELARVAAGAEVAALVAPLAADASSAVRAAALELLSTAAPEAAAPAALDALAADDPQLRRAALSALDALGPGPVDRELERLTAMYATTAERDRALAAGLPTDGEATELLRDALLDRGRRSALVALSALSVRSGDRDRMRLALDHLGDADAGHRANALEAIEAAAGSPVVRALLALWEPTGPTTGPTGPALEAIAAHDDPLIRACAELVRSRRDEGGPVTTMSMSVMERVLVLRRIPLFAALTPAELQRVAEIAEEGSHADGDVLAAEGELGEEMYVVLDGTVRVVRSDGRTVARRGAGDVVGEMSIIAGSPRVASLVAEGEVRTVRVDRRRFESMVRERPDIALAVMRVLVERLAALTSERA